MNMKVYAHIHYDSVNGGVQVRGLYSEESAAKEAARKDPDWDVCVIALDLKNSEDLNSPLYFGEFYSEGGEIAFTRALPSRAATFGEMYYPEYPEWSTYDLKIYGPFNVSL